MPPLSLRYALSHPPHVAREAFDELRALLSAHEVVLEPVFVRDYGALYDALHLGEADVGWCPPLVARDLVREGTATSCAALVRNGDVHYFSAIVASKSVHTPSDIKRFGWVSKLSAAGYFVPRSYLASIGVIDFQEVRFFHSHARAMSALEGGVVDAIATYAIREHPGEQPRVPHAFEGARTLTTMGPIPGDVIVAATSLEDESIERFTKALHAIEIAEGSALAKLTGATRFGPVPHGHLESLSRWVANPVFTRR